MKHKWYTEIVAWAEGKTIQVRGELGFSVFQWKDLTGRELINWDGMCEFRIKPEPKPDVVRSANSKNINMAYMVDGVHPDADIIFIYDGESGKLKSVEIVK